MSRGEVRNTRKPKLGEESVDAIRRADESPNALAKAYGVSHWAIRRALTKATWRHVKGANNK